jgi:hypothetical protein
MYVGFFVVGRGVERRRKLSAVKELNYMEVLARA